MLKKKKKNPNQCHVASLLMVIVPIQVKYKRWKRPIKAADKTQF
jgi:hypothetical protein